MFVGGMLEDIFRGWGGGKTPWGTNANNGAASQLTAQSKKKGLRKREPQSIHWEGKLGIVIAGFGMEIFDIFRAHPASIAKTIQSVIHLAGSGVNEGSARGKARGFF